LAGGGSGTRALYTNDEEKLFDVMRPVILTGIEELASSGDLLDRSLIVTLSDITEEERLEEKDFWARFDAARPALLGALLDVVSAALKALPTSRPNRLCRMADFHRWGVAVERVLGWPAGSFTAAYEANRATAVTLSLEASLVGQVLREWLDIEEKAWWEGTATELFGKLETQAGDRAKKRAWPTDAAWFSGRLRRIAPALRRVGIDVAFEREGRVGKRLIHSPGTREALLMRSSDVWRPCRRRCRRPCGFPRGSGGGLTPQTGGGGTQTAASVSTTGGSAYETTCPCPRAANRGLGKGACSSSSPARGPGFLAGGKASSLKGYQRGRGTTMRPDLNAANYDVRREMERNPPLEPLAALPAPEVFYGERRPTKIRARPGAPRPRGHRSPPVRQQTSCERQVAYYPGLFPRRSGLAEPELP
jgi:hypothetical protein